MERTISFDLHAGYSIYGRDAPGEASFRSVTFTQIRSIHKNMVNDDKQAADDAAAAGEASRVRYSCSQDARDGTGTTHDLDFYFFYEIVTRRDETRLDATKVELQRLQVAYVFQLASQLLPCAGDTETTNESDPLEPSFVISAVDSATDDRLLNIGEIFWRLETR